MFKVRWIRICPAIMAEPFFTSLSAEMQPNTLVALSLNSSPTLRLSEEYLPAIKTSL